jgi:RHS repeat-associated protein
VFVACIVAATSVHRSARAQDGQGVTSLFSLSPARSTGYVAASGTAVEVLPAVVPPGRKHFEPNLAFNYLSQNGTGSLGLGWLLEVGHITRSSVQGIPSESNINEFVFSLAGSADVLIPVGGNSYRPRFESTYRQYSFLTDHWVVLDGKGTQYVFGSDPTTRIDGLEWMLDHVIDTSGNQISITYVQNGGYLYPNQIFYTGYAPTGDLGANHVDFTYEPRNDVTASYALGITSGGAPTSQVRQQRLHEISMFAGNQLVRGYVLNYAYGSTTNRSLLTGIDIIGTDDASVLHAREYQYQTPGTGFSSTTITGAFPTPSNDSSKGTDLGTRFSDVNGDGFADFVDNGSNVYLNDGTGHFAKDDGWSTSFAQAGITFVDSNGVDTGTRLLDVNGDLRPDLLVAPASAPAGVKVLLNTGSGWDATSPLAQAYQTSLSGIQERGQTQVGFTGVACDDGGGPDDSGLQSCSASTLFTANFALVQSAGNSNGASFSDVNGDGLPDIVWSFQNTSAVFGFTPDAGEFGGQTFHFVPVTIRAVWLNNGAGWSRSDTLSSSLGSLPPFVVDSQPEGFDVYDVNGDGIADIVNTEQPSSTDTRGVWLGTAVGWIADSGYTTALQSNGIASLSGTTSLGLVPEDYNRDGLIDLVLANANTQAAFLNTGTSWVPDSNETAILAANNVTFVDGNNNATGFAFTDVNGDGVDDLTRNTGSSGTSVVNAIVLGSGPASELLEQTTTLLGETDQIGYTPSTAFNNLGSDGLHHLPLTFGCVTSLVRADGRGNSFASRVTYAGGLIDQERSEIASFRSFATASTTDSRGVVTARQFEQTEALAGSPTSVQIFDTTSALRSSETIAYETVNAGNGVTQVFSSQDDQQTIDPGGSLHTTKQFQYDAFLNLVELDNLGDVTITGDESTTVNTFAQDLNAGIVSPIATVTVYDSSNTVRSQSTILYDGLSTAGSVTIGNVTEVIDLVNSSGATVSQSTAYDQFGNPVLQVDRNGQPTTFAYDSTNTFRQSATDPLGHTVSDVIDPRFGTATSETDANSQTTTRQYDVFGRLSVETLPGDEASPSGTRTLSYANIGSPTTQYFEVASTETPGQPATLNVLSMLDGFGQVYATQAPGPGAANILTQTSFDDVGNVTSASLQYFTGSTPAFQTTQRDALRRITQVTDARGATTSTTYRGAARDDFDANGNKTTTISNAYGGPTEIDTFVGSNTYKTTKLYDVAGNVTQIVDAVGETTTVSYDDLGRRTQLVDPNAGTFQYAVDGNGNVTVETTPAGTFKFAYAADARLTSKEFPNGDTVSYAYGSAGAANGIDRVTHVVDDAGILDISYDRRGNVAQRVRTIGLQKFLTGYSYDSLGRIRQITYPDGYTVNYAYDASGSASSITDGSGNAVVSSVTYNAPGEMSGVTFGNGVSSTYTFDPAGVLTGITTTNSQSQRLQANVVTVDPARNVKSISDGVYSNLSQTFSYDSMNRLVQATGAYGTEAYEYDGVGTLVRKGQLAFLRDATKQQHVDCAIDLSLSTLLINGLQGNSTLYRCAQSLATDPNLSATDHATLQTILSRALLVGPIGASTEIDYDPSGNVTSEPEAQKTYQYDGENRLVAVGPTLLPIGRNVYDANGQRVIREDADTTTFIDNIYEYEPLGVDVRRNVFLNGRIVASSRGAGVQLITSTPPALLSQGGFFQASGQMMATLFGGGGPAAFARVWVRATLGARGALVLTGILCALGALLAPRLLTRLGRLAVRRLTPIAVGSVRLMARRRSLWAMSVVLVAIQLFELAIPNTARANNLPPIQTFYYHVDQAGNVNVITDWIGNEYKRFDYHPYGEQTVTGVGVGDDDLDISYDSHHFDTEEGIYYFGARHYDATLGRFLSPDSQVTSGSPQSLQRYALNLDNPLRYIDITGHESAWDWVVGAVVTFLTIVAVVGSVVLAIGTGGALSPVAAIVIGAVAGAAAGAAIGLGVGYFVLKLQNKSQLGDLLAITFAGAIVGAFTGGAAASLFAPEALGAAATTAGHIAALTLVGGATGSIGGLTVGIINHASPDNLFWAVVAGGLVGAAVGGLVGVGFPIAPETVAQATNGVTAYFGAAAGATIGSLLPPILLPIVAAGLGVGIAERIVPPNPAGGTPGPYGIGPPSNGATITSFQGPLSFLNTYPAGQ